MHYLGADDITAINQVVIEESGGSVRIREPGLLNSIAKKPLGGFGDHELYPGLLLKAAVLYEAIVNYHVFIDGNKRTGFAAMARFLYLNGYSLKVTDKEIVDYTVAIATSRTDLTDIAAWIENHSKKVGK